MYATIPVETESKALQIGIGFASHQDAIWAAVRATAMARTGLHGTSPDLVLLVTAGMPAPDVGPPLPGGVGAVGGGGGGAPPLLAHHRGGAAGGPGISPPPSAGGLRGGA